MTTQEIRDRIEEIGIIPAVRLYSAGDALFAAEAVCESGIPIVEVTMTVPGAVDVIRDLIRHKTQVIVGAGTLIDVESAQRCLDVGAAFLTTTGLDLEIVEFALKRGTVVFPGVLTPSDVLAAWKAGAGFVKVFPCAEMGGPSYIRTLKRPFPQIRMIAAGGVNQKTARDFILAGASALGIGGDLIHEDAIKRREVGWIHELGRRYLNMVREARSLLKESKT
jgi:2-dehydro-3-deoxyphosphogluconate aldolase/(4S)-4-hydroxy-2-oxoglutarate aldolase